MAPDPALSERIYQELRRRLLAGGFKLRERLDVARIASEMQASATPVREALARLAAERLIKARPARGFFAVLWTEAELKALYEWRGALVQMAADARKEFEPRMLAAGDYGDVVRTLFASIESEANHELRHAAANADDRLHAARRVELEIVPGAPADAQAIAASGSKRALIAALRRYHAKRLVNVAAIRERALLQALPPNGE
ncbi:MAG: GntR family transcriptional regulator [Hyphomonadaceae bacterium]